MNTAPFGSFGLGMRKPHYPIFLEGLAKVDFVEVISENFMIDGGQPRRILRQVREHYSVALHGVSMSIGSAEACGPDYLGRLRELVDEIDPLFVSDHLCWTGIGGFNSHDLLPLPYDEETLAIAAANVDRAQSAIGRTMLIENPSSYIAFGHSTMSEWDFLDQLCVRTGCELLLDVNNVFVSASNHGFNPIDYLNGIQVDRVRQIHLAGHSTGDTMLIDTHDQPVCGSVWDLYAHIIPRLGHVATMIERDDDIPSIGELLDELDFARHLSGLREAA